MMGSFIYKNRKIEYTLLRKKVKNINLRIKTDGSVTVSAPKTVTQKSIDDFLYSQGEKILRALDRFSQSRQNGYDLNHADVVPVLGKERRLEILPAERDHYCLLNDSLIFYLKDADDILIKRRLYDSVLTETAKRIFPPLFEACFEPFKNICGELPQLKIRKMKSQWGNCRSARNRITLNSRLAAFEIDVIRFVIYHEFCHFIQPNHSPAFYSELEKIMPDWKKYDQVLKNKLIY